MAFFSLRLSKWSQKLYQSLNSLREVIATEQLSKVGLAFYKSRHDTRILSPLYVLYFLDV